MPRRYVSRVSAIRNIYSASLIPFDWCSLSVRTTLQSVPKYLVWFVLRLSELHRTKLWCWVVITAVGCRPMRFLFRHNRSVWCWILITPQFKPEELSDLHSWTNMSVCADANITGTFLHVWTHKVHYKLHQSRVQNFDDGGFLSEWSFVRWSYGRWSFVRTPRLT